LKALSDRNGLKLSIGAGALFFLAVTATSAARWANFEYRTFDLAFYVQGIWQFLHGRFDVSLLQVPLLGNHVEPIVFLLAPALWLTRHPLILVVVQNTGLALMAPTAFRIARRLGLAPSTALAAAASILAAPAACYVALHEFHPEAFSAPLLLLMFEARLAKALRRYWICFLAALACKENMALLLGAYCVVSLFVSRPRDWTELRRWFVWPLVVALAWLLVCAGVITPALNHGNVDYGVLYGRLGDSTREILWNLVVRPQLAASALQQSILHGNLIWALLLPFVGLPLLRPRWLLIACPILLQHLLSWRQSEWTIYFHYAAPLLPLFWMAAVEAVGEQTSVLPPLVQRWGTVGMLAGCVIAQAFLGPLPEMAGELAGYPAKRAERDQKNSVIAQIPADASVVAPLSYLSHLAMREHIYSLHFILKGLRTLSHASFEPPPPTDFVLIDRADSATYDAAAGFYHPAMKTQDGRVILSSDELLEQFLGKADWDERSTAGIILLRNKSSNNPDSH
jgi:uncharacterized membrane protein